MAEDNEERVVEALSASIAAVRVSSDPYWAATDVCDVAVHFIEDSAVATSVYLVWSSLTDRCELRPHRRDETIDLIRRAAAEWADIAKDENARAAYLDHWRYEICRYARPGSEGPVGRPVGQGSGEPFALRDLDDALDRRSLLASLMAVRVLDGGAVLELDLALHLRRSDRPRDERSPDATAGLRCHGVRGWTLSGESVDCVRMVDDHPALVPFEPSRSRLSYRGKPESPEAMLAALHLAHARAVGSGVPMFLQPGSAFAPGWTTGTVAEGPTSLMEIYADALRRQGLDAVLTRTSATAGTDSPAIPKACQIGSGYVLAETFETYGRLPSDLA